MVESDINYLAGLLETDPDDIRFRLQSRTSLEIFKKPELKKIMHYLEQTYRPPRNLFNFSSSGNKPEYSGRIWAYITSDHYRTNARIIAQQRSGNASNAAAPSRTIPQAPQSRNIPQAAQPGPQTLAGITPRGATEHFEADFDIVDLLNSSDDNNDDDDSDEDFLQTLVASIEDQGGIGQLNDPYPYSAGSSSFCQGTSTPYYPNYGVMGNNQTTFGQSYSGSSPYVAQPSYQSPYGTAQEQHMGPAFIPNPSPAMNNPVSTQSIPAQHIPAQHLAKRPKVQEAPQPRPNQFMNTFNNAAQMIFPGGNSYIGQQQQLAGSAANAPGKPASIGMGGVEVKHEKPVCEQPLDHEVDNLTAMQRMGIRRGIALTALRMNDNKLDRAIQHAVKVTRDSDDPQQLQQLRQASMESERSNDNRKKMNKLIEQQLLVSGQVEKQVFEKSILWQTNDKKGCKAFRRFLDQLASSENETYLPNDENPNEAQQGDYEERRRLVVSLLFRERDALKFYPKEAPAYLADLVGRMGQVTAKAAKKGGHAKGEDVPVPLDFLKQELEKLEKALYHMPEQNLGGVPPAFLEFSKRASLEEDGLEIVGYGELPGKSNSSESKNSKEECIEVIDD